jgi:site-specific recombinase XerD
MNIKYAREACLKINISIFKEELNMKYIEKYFDHLRSRRLRETSIDYIFISHIGKNKKIDCLALYKIIYYAIQKYNWPKFNLYSLRASSATHLLENGMRILHIKKLLGHESLNTTRLYLRISTLELKKKLDKCHPRNKYK